MARILVTGATGHAGRFVVPALLAAGHEVRGLFRKAPGDHPNVEWQQADLATNPEYDSFLAGCDAVIHLAAELREPNQMDAINVDATRCLISKAAERGIRYFGYASSIVVYGSPHERFVDERSPRINPHTSIVSQYHAEPYMLQYARTKAAAEIAIEELNAPMITDLYRPAVIVDYSEMLRAADWSYPRKLFASYRRTQFVTAIDAASAITHLLKQGLEKFGQKRAAIEAYNIVDDTVVTYQTLLARAYKATGDARFKVVLSIPVIMDLIKDFVFYRNTALRYPLGMLQISPRKLLETGFSFPIGFDRALSRAIAAFDENRN